MAPQWLTADKALVPDFDPDRIEEDEGKDRIERPVLPFANLFENRIGDR